MMKWVKWATLVGALAAVVTATCDFDAAKDLRSAGIFLAKGDTDQALRLSRRAMYMGGLSVKDKTAALIIQAKAFTLAGRKSLAQERLDQLIALRPDYGDGYLQRGQLKLGLRDYRGALADLEKGVALRSGPGGKPGPALALALYWRGEARLALGRADQAWADATQALQWQPRLAEGYYLKSLILEKRRDPAMALDAMETAYGLKSGDPFSSWFLKPQGQSWLHRLVMLRLRNKVDPQRPFRKF